MVVMVVMFIPDFLEKDFEVGVAVKFDLWRANGVQGAEEETD